MTGTHWITESGFLETPILITNTGNVGTVRDAAWQWMDHHHYYSPFGNDYWYAYPLWQKHRMAFLNDINGQHVKKENVFAAFDSAKSGVFRGRRWWRNRNDMLWIQRWHWNFFKSLSKSQGGYTVGVLVQCNHGRRYQLRLPGCQWEKNWKIR